MSVCKKNRYDAIIIGAGVGGLICGCYLAKNGMKVLIAEKNNFPGGYCSSFSKNGFKFDVGIHYLGGYRKNGPLRKLFEYLKLEKYVKILSLDPYERILTLDYEIVFTRNHLSTLETLQKIFPLEAKQLKDFFDLFTTSKSIFSIARFRKKTFSNLLSLYFKDNKLQNIFKIMLGNVGLPSHRLAAISAILLFKEFILDGGYYPQGGMGSFSESLAKRFIDFGGDLILGQEVERILLKNNRAYGISIKNQDIFCDSVVSNCDARHTFIDLIGKNNITGEFGRKMGKLVSSASLFIVYLGLSKSVKDMFKYKCGVWLSLKDDADKFYEKVAIEGKVDSSVSILFCSFPSFYDPNMAPLNKETMHLIISAPFKNKRYWNENKELLAQKLIEKANLFIPNLKNQIEIMDTATPITLYNYTRNYRGASYGWASTPEQIERYIMPHKTEIQNLYLTGHWTTMGTGQGGIIGVINSGITVSKTILKERKLK